MFEEHPLFAILGGKLTVKDAYLSATGATDNQVIVAAVSGKQILVLSFNCWATGAAGSIGFRNGSGGGYLYTVAIPASTSSEPNVILPPSPYGYMRTSAGTGLYVNNTSAAAASVQIQYVELVA